MNENIKNSLNFLYGTQTFKNGTNKQVSSDKLAQTFLGNFNKNKLPTLINELSKFELTPVNISVLNKYRDSLLIANNALQFIIIKRKIDCDYSVNKINMQEYLFSLLIFYKIISKKCKVITSEVFFEMYNKTDIKIHYYTII